MKSIHLELIAYTEVRAHHLNFAHAMSFILLSKSNMHVQLSENRNGALEVDNRMWSNIPLPPVVVPSFRICNLLRKYEISVKIGLCYGQANAILVGRTIFTFIFQSTSASSVHSPKWRYSSIIFSLQHSVQLLSCMLFSFFMSPKFWSMD